MQLTQLGSAVGGGAVWAAWRWWCAAACSSSSGGRWGSIPTARSGGAAPLVLCGSLRVHALLSCSGSARYLVSLPSLVRSTGPFLPRHPGACVSGVDTLLWSPGRDCRATAAFPEVLLLVSSSAQQKAKVILFFRTRSPVSIM